jgi:hypothetical protein
MDVIGRLYWDICTAGRHNKGTAISVHAWGYTWPEVLARVILNLGPRRRWVVKFTSWTLYSRAKEPQISLNGGGGLFRPQDRSGRFWKRQNTLTVPGTRTPNHAAILYTGDVISAPTYSMAKRSVFMLQQVVHIFTTRTKTVNFFHIMVCIRNITGD